MAMSKKQSPSSGSLSLSTVFSQSSTITNSKSSGGIQYDSLSNISNIVSSPTNSNERKDVYVRDNIYTWLPAEIQSSTPNNHSKRIEVKVVLPDDWIETTILYDESSIKELEHENRQSHVRNGDTILSKRQAGKKSSFRKFMDHASDRKKKHNEKDKLGRNIADGIIRSVVLHDYPNGALPIQNIERKSRRLSNNNDCGKIGSESLVNARDMTDLPFLHEAAVLYNLKLRHKRRMPYTRVGDIIVALNPCQWIKGLYSYENQTLYAQRLIWGIRDAAIESICNSPKENWQGASIDSHNNDPMNKHQPMACDSYYSKLGVEPHIFETASLAYSGLTSAQQNQTILVSGESGAGKTESVKIVMTYLAKLEQTRPSYTSENGTGKEGYDRKRDERPEGIVRRVIESNPLFESFGNAKTSRNDNSSRFGRFTQLQFDVESLAVAARNGRRSAPRCVLAGGLALTYLLEKTRVVDRAVDERNYHIFHQLLAAPEVEKIAIWDGLAGKTHKSFKYICNSNITSSETKSDRNSWVKTRSALELFGFTGNDFQDLMQALCVILQLGNLHFESDEGGVKITPDKELTKLSYLMGIPRKYIIQAMLKRISTIRDEEVVTKLNPTDAKDGCDALAKEIYSLLFGVIVCQINMSTSPKNMVMQNGMPFYPGSTFGTISLLDIFGFESFETNRFEQLCINYANERLQQKYIFDNFNTAQEEYRLEGIEVFDFSLVDNSDVVDLFEGSGKGNRGLVSLLGQECVRSNGTDLSFIRKFKKNAGVSSRLYTDRLNEREFGIRHFAGNVTYNVNKFLQSNTDRIPDDLVKCASRSVNNVIGKGFSAIAAINQTKLNETNVASRKSMSSKRTVLAKFRSQIGAIIKTIESTRTRYIRCIKPNVSMIPEVTDHHETMRQLISAGLITAITISRESYPNKMYYNEVWDRFQCIYNPKMETCSFESPTTAVKKMLSSLLVDPFMLADGALVPSYACGKTKVYFRSGALEQLETDRLEYYSVYATIIQAWWLSQISRVHYHQLKLTTILLQAMIRGMFKRSEYIKTRCNAIIIQARRRGKIIRSSYLMIRCATYICQKMIRGKLMRAEFLQLKCAAVVCQKWRRRKIAVTNLRRLQYRQRHYAAILLQRMVRQKVAKFQFLSIKDAVVCIQTLIRRKLLHQKYLKLQYVTVVTQTRRRGKVARSRYLQIQCAVSVLQKAARLKAALSRYVSMKDVAVRIQAFIRGHTTLKKYRRLKLSLIVIQTWTRGQVVRSRYIQMQYAASVLQKAFRLKVARHRYTLMKVKVIYIQTLVRQKFALKKYSKFCQMQYAASVYIQTWIRWKISEQKYRRLQLSTIFVQARRRGKVERINYLRTQNAAYALQKFIRMNLAHSRYIIMKAAAVCIQSWVRGQIMMQKYRRLQSRRRQYAATILQTDARARAAQCQYLLMKDAVICLQSWIRGQIMLRRYRGLKSQKNRRLHCFTVTTQARRRSKAACSRFGIMKNAAICIQRWVRGEILLRKRRDLHHLFVGTQNWRGCVVRSKHTEMKYTVPSLQKATYLKAAQSQFISLEKAAECIQTWIRKKNFHQKYLKLQYVTTVAQTRRRGKVARSRYLQMQSAATILQTSIRGKMVRSRYHKQPQRKTLEKVCEGNSSDSRCPQMQSATPILQTSTRDKIARSRYHERPQRKTLERAREGNSNDPSAKIQRDLYHENLSADIFKFTKLISLKDSLFEIFLMLHEHNCDLAAAIKELENDKQDIVYHSQALETKWKLTSIQAQDLTGMNNSLTIKISNLRQANERLKNDILLVKKQKDECLLERRKKYIKNLSRYDSKINSLEEMTKSRSYKSTTDVVRLTKKLDQESEDHLLEVYMLKGKLHKTTSSHPNYWERLTDAVESSYFAKEAEVKKFTALLDQVKNEKDEEIKKLKEEMTSLQEALSISAVCEFE